MSALEDELAFQMKAIGLPEPVRELHFDWCCEHPKLTHRAPLLSGTRPYCAGCQNKHQRHAYKKGRAFRFDFCWPDKMLAVEVEGGTRSGGRHVRPLGFERDAEKQNRAVELGWRVLRFPAAQITSGAALNTIEAVLKAAKED